MILAQASVDARVFAVISVVTGVVVTIFWIVVGWRAMRAHETIADALSTDASQRVRLARAQATTEQRTFRDFLNSDPHAKHLDANEQMRRFCEWKRDQDISGPSDSMPL